MCDYFSQRNMDDDNGDLTDIVRVGGHSSNADLEPFLDDDDANWQQVDHLLSNSDFGDPFADLQDPLLKPYVAAGGATGYDHDGFGDRFQLLPPPPPPPPPPPKAVEEEIVKGAASATSSILSKVHQISLSPLLPRLIRPTPVAAGEITMKVISAGAADHYGEAAQISPHRPTPGNKRRKGQAKRVVYVPAPAAAASNSNRSSGEVVPSDLWAWRKYGQKPIKGSPYPRGYYKCSSSKGCSARKQVERSRTDPNMLVVTYTSEHNHPWPTQRNALAGSVRSPYSKSTKPPSADCTVAATDAEAPPVSGASPLVNEETPAPAHFDQIGVCYVPMIPEADQPDDFFSDLAELESDPMSLIFSEGFMEGKTDAAAAAAGVGKATADPLFTMFD